MRSLSLYSVMLVAGVSDLCSQPCFRTVASGVWSDPAIWQISVNRRWVPAWIAPDASADSIIISRNTSVDVESEWTVDQLVVEGDLSVAPGRRLNAGPGPFVLTVRAGGRMINSGFFEGDVNRVRIEDGGYFRHNPADLTGVIPLGIWAPESILEITGLGGAVEAYPGSNWSQAFGHVYWNTESLTADFVLHGLLNRIAGDLRIRSTNGRLLRMTDRSDARMDIGGSFIVDSAARFSVSSSGPCRSRVSVSVGGDFRYAGHPTGPSGFCEQGVSDFTVGGDFIMTQGMLYFSSGSGGTSSSGADLILSGDFRLEGGTLDASIAWSNRVGDLYFRGDSVQRFINRGRIIGAFHHHIDPDRTLLIPDGHVLVGQSLEIGNGNRGASLIVQSTDPAGAIGRGTAASGNVRVRTQYWRQGSLLVYGGEGRQYISGDHPSASAVTTVLDNADGLEVSPSSGSVICGSGLVMRKGDLLIRERYVTVKGDLTCTAEGTAHLDASGRTTALGLTVEGALIIGDRPLRISGSRISNAGNAVLTLNGDFLGSGFLRFEGPNCHVVIGGAERMLSRPFPIDKRTEWESLSLEASGPLTVELNQPVTIGGFHPASGYTGGLFIKSGKLRVTTGLTVTSACQVDSGVLEFSGASAEFQRQIRCRIPHGLLAADRFSSLHITSGFSGTDNLLAFRPGQDTIGYLRLDRSADVTAVGNLPVTPHISLSGNLTVIGRLYLQDGEMFHGGGLRFGQGAELIRTTAGRFSDSTRWAPKGGPYRVIYASDRVGGGVIHAGLEAQGAVRALRVEGNLRLMVAHDIHIQDSVMLDQGVMEISEGALSIGEGGRFGLCEGGRYLGPPPGGPGYHLFYSGTSGESGNESAGELSSATVRVSDTLVWHNSSRIRGEWHIATGVVRAITDSIRCSGFRNESVFHAPKKLVVSGYFHQRGRFHHQNGRIMVRDSVFWSDDGNSVFHTVAIGGRLIRSGMLRLEGDLECLDSGTQEIDGISFQGGRRHRIGGVGGVRSGNLIVADSDSVFLEILTEISGEVSLSRGARLECGDRQLRLIASGHGHEGGRIAVLHDSAVVSGAIVMDREWPQKPWGFRYVSAPLAGGPISQWSTMVPLRKHLMYDETVLGHKDSGFLSVDVSRTSVAGRGYVVRPVDSWQGKPFPWTCTGRLMPGLSRGRVILPVTFTPSDPMRSGHDGWNLVGNPYPAPVYWSADTAAWRISGISPWVFVPASDGNGHRWFNRITGEGDLLNGEIAPGQSFWVYAYEPAPVLWIKEPAKLNGRVVAERRIPYGGIRLNLIGGKVVVGSAIVSVRSDAVTVFDALTDAVCPPVDGPSVGLLGVDGNVCARKYFPKPQDAIRFRVFFSGEEELSLALDSDTLPTGSGFILREMATGKKVHVRTGDTVALHRSGPDDFSDYDLSGSPELSPVRDAESDGLIVFPNPSDGRRLHVRLVEGLPGYEKVTAGGSEFLIRDLAGRLVHSQPVRGTEFDVDLPELPAGMYLVSLKEMHSDARIRRVLGRTRLVVR